MRGGVLLPEFLPAAVRNPAPREPADASAGAEFDRFINDRLAAGSEDLWIRCCTSLGLAHLTDDDRFADNATRVRNRDVLTAEIEAVLRTRPSAHWLDVLEREGIPAAEVQGIDSVLAGPQPEALGSVQRLEHTTAGPYRVVGVPLRIDGEPLPSPSAAPVFGADTRTVLIEAGMAAAEVDELIDAGVAVTP